MLLEQVIHLRQLFGCEPSLEDLSKLRLRVGAGAAGLGIEQQ